MDRKNVTAIPHKLNMFLLLSTLFFTADNLSASERPGGIVLSAKDKITIVKPANEIPCMQYQERTLPPSEELAFYLEKLTGTKAEVRQWAPELKDRKNIIFIGEAAQSAGGFSKAEIEQCGPDGFRIRIKDGRAYIAGGRYRGAEYGIYKFLEMSGVKFYAYNYEELPRPGAIKLPETDLLEKAFFEYRPITGNFNRLGQQTIINDIGYPKTADPALAKEWGGWIPCFHTSEFLCPVTVYGREHPEYYARDKDGKSLAERFLKDWRPGKSGPSYIHVCMSNQEVRKISQKNLDKWLNIQNERRYFDISQMDSFDWCECENCRKLDVEAGRNTDRLLDYANALVAGAASKHPDKIFTVLAYLKNTGRPPLKEKPVPNLRVLLCPYTPEVQDRAHNLDHPLNREFYSWYKGWLKTIPPGQLYIYDYPYTGFLELSFIHEATYEKMKMYAHDGVKGIYFDGRPAFMQDLFVYVTGRLAWKPDADTDKLTNEFICSYYGPAAPEILKIYAMLREIGKDKNRSQGPTLDTAKFYSEEELEKVLKLFADAENTVKDKPEYLNRVSNEKSFALYSWLMKCNPVKGTARNMELFKKRMGEYLGLALSKGSKQHFCHRSGDWLKSWFWKTARLKIDPSEWPKSGFQRMEAMRKYPLISKLITAPQEVEISASSAIRKIQRLPDGRGWEIPLALFEGVPDPCLYKWACPPHEAIFVKSKLSGLPWVTHAYFKLNYLPQKATLLITGQDDDKPGKTPLRIVLNGKELFRGENNFVENNWSDCKFEIPPGVLKKGENELVIEDMSETGDPFAKWFAIGGVKISTDEKIPESGSCLFKLDFDKSLRADIGVNPEPNLKGKIILSPDGREGKALDAGYSLESSGALFYQAAEHYLLERGTAEMWIKISWDPAKDKETRTLLHVVGNLRSGIFLFKYKQQQFFTFLMYNDVKNTGDYVTGPIKDWKPDTWHHVAITWEEKEKTLQIFFDGILAGKNSNAVMGKELADKIYIGSRDKLHDPAGALIDDFRIYDYVLWHGNKIGEKVFSPESRLSDSKARKNI